jgi:hypothetical protein
MSSTIELKPGQNRLEEHWQFSCYLTAGATPRCVVRGVVLDPALRTPDRREGPVAPTLVLPMSPDEAIQLARAISQAVTTANIPLPSGVLVRSE